MRQQPVNGRAVASVAGIGPTPSLDEAEAAAAAVRAGDEAAFGALVERYRRELHVHCYRMLGSFDEAEDLVQETFLRAWRFRDGFDGGPHFRAWLYRIATNACTDAHRRRARRVRTVDSYADLPWLQPYPDRLLDQVAADDDEPDHVVVARETIELAFIAALQLLPPRQRSVLIARDVLGWPAAEVAAALELSVPSVNSALQRGRATLQERLPARRLDWSTTALSDDERDVLALFIDAHERHDAEASAALLRDDTRITMPPAPIVFEGRETIAGALRTAFGPEEVGDWRLVPTAANRLPAAASYLRKWGDDTFRAFKLDVLRVVDGGIAEITTFGYSRFPAFGLPATLDD
jgi:RNA polymerase sigma-70 factor (TIGR02960 family)